MNKSIFFATSIFLSLLFVPHALLGFNGYYLTKLNVVPSINGEFYIGVMMAAVFMGLFMLCAQLSQFSKTTLKTHVHAVESRRSFRTIIVLLTLVMFVFLSIGIGAKQSGNSLNFLIRLLPRELILIITVTAAAATWKRFWIVLMLLNILYWVGIGSKASLFLVALTLLYYHALEGTRIRPSYILWGAGLSLLLPVSYLLPLASETGMSIFGVLKFLYDSPDLSAMMSSRVLGRVSWFDGMLLTPRDLAPMAHFSLTDFIDVALAGFVPGMTANEAPLGTQLSYLFRSGANLENFAGAIGIPGVFKMMLYNFGLPGLLGLLAIIALPLSAIMAMAASKDPFWSLLGFAALVLLMLTLFISGNVDSAFGRIIPLIISGIFYLVATRRLFLAKNYSVT
ncbi:MAG: hypothetical protein N4A61_02040 [Pelagimonas sp.]|jgi:hypothetical protein|nr:hypothetical protein [Pelagimonas sp.]